MRLQSNWVVVFGLAFAALSAAAPPPARDPAEPACPQQLIYLTDNPETLRTTIANRAALYGPGLRADWETAKADFFTNPDGEEILVIKGLEVMRGFEKPYMASIAKTVASRGGKVLNVGYGIGFIDAEIERLREQFPITEHHIIELNADVAARAVQWRERQPHRDLIFIHQGDWNQQLNAIVATGTLFDGIAYDAFPLEEQELHRDFVPFLEEVIKLRAIKEGSGLITFYMDSADGFGSRFLAYARGLGVESLSTEKVFVTLPISGNQYWERNYFFTPTLTQIRYGDER